MRSSNMSKAFLTNALVTSDGNSNFNPVGSELLRISNICVRFWVSHCALIEEISVRRLSDIWANLVSSVLKGARNHSPDLASLRLFYSESATLLRFGFEDNDASPNLANN